MFTVIASIASQIRAATTCFGPGNAGSIVTEPSATGGRPWAASVRMVRSGCDSDVAPSLSGQLDDEVDWSLLDESGCAVGVVPINLWDDLLH